VRSGEGAAAGPRVVPTVRRGEPSCRRLLPLQGALRGGRRAGWEPFGVIRGRPAPPSRRRRGSVTSPYRTANGRRACANFGGDMPALQETGLWHHPCEGACYCGRWQGSRRTGMARHDGWLRSRRRRASPPEAGRGKGRSGQECPSYGREAAGFGDPALQNGERPVGMLS